MKCRRLVVGPLVALACGLFGVPAARAADSLNMLVIMADDIGWMNVSSYVFYYDETVLTAVRFRQFKVTFSAKFGGRWDNPLQSLGRPLITNLLMDPFERQTGDVARQYAEHKTWVLTPILGVVQQHLATFKEFPIRQLGLSADVGKTIEGIQSQILRPREAGN